MDNMEVVLVGRIVERLFIVASGMACVFLGYRLFIKGVTGKASLKASIDSSKVQLLNAAPGLFFALFGAAILVFACVRSVSYERSVWGAADGKEAKAATDSSSPAAPASVQPAVQASAAPAAVPSHPPTLNRVPERTEGRTTATPTRKEAAAEKPSVVEVFHGAKRAEERFGGTEPKPAPKGNPK